MSWVGFTRVGIRRGASRGFCKPGVAPVRATTCIAPLPLHKQACASSSSTKTVAPDTIIETFQGGEHEFSSSRARENLSEAMETGSFPDQGHVNQLNGKKQNHTEKKEFQGKDAHLGKYDCHGSVSLYSVMQSNVPEPFQPVSETGSTPTHLNMPGGGIKLRDKYLSEKRVKSTYESFHTNTKRKFSTSALNSSVEASINFQSDIPCPQGVQGLEDCSNFKLWLENCQKYGFSSCVEQLEGIQSGRKTLHQVFAEQEELIKQIAQNYYQRRPSQNDMQGVQGYGSMSMDGPDVQGLQGEIPQGGVESLAMMSNPCPQGVQGDDCVQFKLWLQNCVQYGIGDCQQQLEDLRAGRRTLAQVFSEQEQLIRDVAMQYSAASQPPGLGSSTPGPERN